MILDFLQSLLAFVVCMLLCIILVNWLALPSYISDIAKELRQIKNILKERK